MTITDALLILGLIGIMGYAVYAAADDVAHESRKRKELRRLRSLEAAREAWAREIAKEAALIERNHPWSK
jgi:hypothetical protein